MRGRTMWRPGPVPVDPGLGTEEGPCRQPELVRASPLPDGLGRAVRGGPDRGPAGISLVDVRGGSRGAGVLAADALRLEV